MKIAVIGSGISGLGAAYILAPHHEVHLFEASDRLGGHAHTVKVSQDGVSLPMDTGFLVFNDLTYPHLKAFFAHLGVVTSQSDMSLSIAKGNLEWSGTNLNTVYGQRRNLLRPSFHLMLFEILRFHREAEENLRLSRRHGWTVGDLLRERRFRADFATDYLLPMAAAIWSTPEHGMRDFPAATFLTFLLNHKLVQVNDRPQWSTVKNGSIEYVQKVAQHLPHVHLSTAVVRVERRGLKVVVKTADAETLFDRVVLATHAPVTARILEMTPAERETFAHFRVEANRAVLHRDVALMPRQKRCWASWNVFAADGAVEAKASLTYHLNQLQPLATQVNYFLTLNPLRSPQSPVRELEYDHPQFDFAAIRAQARIPELQGQGGVYFAGAWTRYGFHEDGLLSAVNVAKFLGVETPWKVAAHE